MTNNLALHGDQPPTPPVSSKHPATVEQIMLLYSMIGSAKSVTVTDLGCVYGTRAIAVKTKAAGHSRRIRAAAASPVARSMAHRQVPSTVKRQRPAFHVHRFTDNYYYMCRLMG